MGTAFFAVLGTVEETYFLRIRLARLRVKMSGEEYEFVCRSLNSFVDILYSIFFPLMRSIITITSINSSKCTFLKLFRMLMAASIAMLRPAEMAGVSGQPQRPAGSVSSLSPLPSPPHCLRRRRLAGCSCGGGGACTDGVGWSVLVQYPEFTYTP